MILVIEKSPDNPKKWAIRVVAEDVQDTPKDVEEIRYALQKATANLPKHLSQVTICYYPKRRSTDVKEK